MIQSQWRRNGTKVLGYATMIVASALAVPDLISPQHIKWFAFANLVLGGFTVKRGHTNTAAK